MTLVIGMNGRTDHFAHHAREHLVEIVGGACLNGATDPSSQALVGLLHRRRSL
jgi:hypothetical protein